MVAESGGAPLKTVGVRLLQLAATLLVTWFVVTKAGLRLSALTEVDLSGWDPSWLLLGASVVLLLGGYFATGYLWGHIVEDLGGPHLAPTLSVRLFMIANLGRYVPGKVWQIAGLAALGRQVGVPGATATAAAVLGQGIALASATLIGLGSVWTLAGDAAWRWAVPGVLLGGMALGLSSPVFDSVTGAWFRVARSERPPGLTPSRAVGWLVIGLASWIVYTGAFYVLVLGLGFDSPLLATMSAFAAAYVLGYVMVFAPAGIGVREGFLIALLSPQIGAGPAGALAVIARVWTTLVEIVPAAAFWARHLTMPVREGGRADG